jgi:RNA-directed DNA polymerase
MESRKTLVVQADAVRAAECNTGEVKTQGEAREPRRAGSPGSETSARTQGLPRNLGDPVASARVGGTCMARKRAWHGAAGSRSAAVGAKKQGNRPEGTLWSKGRRRELEPNEGTIGETLSSPTVSTKIERIAELARNKPGAVLTTLAHHIDTDWLREAYRRTRKDGAAGVDGRGATEYAERLEDNLRSLLDRAKSGTYRAPPVRRVHIPKGDGEQTRPIGIPTFEDKVLQRAVAMVLEAIYEQSFHDCSYGFRPGRSAHQALQAVQRACWKMGGGWVLEVDIKSFFDTLDHAMLRTILSQRVRDGVILRLIGKWLNAGVMEGVILSHAESGTPQGGVISPLLANVYLHEVLDEWFVRTVQPRLAGRAELVRYADDFVIIFERKADAERMLEVLPKRFGKYGLTLHPTKTRLVPFRRPDRSSGDGGGSPGTFDLLGFTLHWGQSQHGWWLVKFRTAKDRFSRTLRRVREWCREHRHAEIEVQHRALVRKMSGHYAYYGVTHNSDALGRFAYEVRRIWRAWLSRRSQKAFLTWEAMNRLLQRYALPRPRIVYRIGT